MGSFLEESHHVGCCRNNHLSIHEFYETSHRCLYINHSIMSSFKPFSKKMFMKLRKFWWFCRKSTSRKITVFSRSSHRTDRHLWCIVTLSSESFKFISKYTFIVLYVMSSHHISRVQNLKDFFDICIHILTISDIFIINSIYLRSSKWDRNIGLNKDIMPSDFCIFSFMIFRHQSCKLDNIRLRGKFSSLCSETRRFCIPNTDFHNSNGVRK